MIKDTILMIAGVTAQPKLAAINDMEIVGATTLVLVRAKITRSSATTVFVTFEAFQGDEGQFSAASLYFLFEPSITVNNLTSATNLIDIQGATSGAETIVCKQLMITKLLK